MSRTLVGNKIVYHSDVDGASLVGAVPTTSSFSTLRQASTDWAKTRKTGRAISKYLDFVCLILDIWQYVCDSLSTDRMVITQIRIMFPDCDWRIFICRTVCQEYWTGETCIDLDVFLYHNNDALLPCSRYMCYKCDQNNVVTLLKKM